MLRNCPTEFLLISFLLSLDTITSHGISPEHSPPPSQAIARVKVTCELLLMFTAKLN